MPIAMKLITAIRKGTRKDKQFHRYITNISHNFERGMNRSCNSKRKEDGVGAWRGKAWAIRTTPT